MFLGLAVQHVDISPIMNSVAAVHHSTAPPLVVQHSVDNKSRPPPITPVIQNTNQVIFRKLDKNSIIQITLHIFALYKINYISQLTKSVFVFFFIFPFI